MSVKEKKLDHPAQSLAGALVLTAGGIGTVAGLAHQAAHMGQGIGRGAGLAVAGLAAVVAGVVLTAKSSSQHDVVVTKTALATNFPTLEEAKAEAAKIDRSRSSDYSTSVRETVDGTYAVFDQGHDGGYEQQPAPWVPGFS